MESTPALSISIKQSLTFDLTEDQEIAVVFLENLLQTTTESKCLLLKGYAGTGKTTLLGALVKQLPAIRWKSVLLAPTGRAAKVLSNSAKKPATTIHKKIYKRQMKADGTVSFLLGKNLHTDTVFIVDEASMVGDYTYTKEGGISSRNILEDLMEFVFSGKNCRLILMGDEAQLPPVGADYSPALDIRYMENHFPFISFKEIALRQVVRQEVDSLILKNATELRSLSTPSWPQLVTHEKADFIRLAGNDLQETLEACYSAYGKDETILVCRSNKRANMFNQQIRGRILDMEEGVCSGDYLMVVKNNYFWLGEETEAGFLANGEIVKVKKIIKREELYGFHFARAIIELIDYPKMDEIEVVINLDALESEGPSLTREQMKLLFFSVEKEYLHIKNKRERYEKILNNQYFAAVQVKFAYAVTCHKSQGGQWSAVFIDHGYLPDGANNRDFHRWLYTAITRATKKVYLVNFDEKFFGN